jgi:predicted chitinase
LLDLEDVRDIRKENNGGKKGDDERRTELKE